MPDLRRPALILVLATAVAGVLAARRFTRFAIAEDSMAPALRDGDWVVAARLRRQPRHGDIVIFDHPHRPGFALVKRVVGLPGETSSVDGRSWLIGPGEVFVLSDNRAASTEDGRTLGPLPVDTLEWRVLGRYWPLPVASLPDIAR